MVTGSSPGGVTMAARSAVVLLAGGSGTRMDRTENKVYLEVGGRTLLAWSLATFQASPAIGSLVLVVREGDEPRAEAIVREVAAGKVEQIVQGGDTRHESEQAGLEALAGPIASGAIDLVLVHDAARPFVSAELLAAVIDTALEVGGAVPGLPLDAEFLLRTSGEDPTPVPVPTDELRRVQTPQAFRAAPLLAAFRRASEAGFHGADTAESVERFSDLEVRIVPGDPDNIKVTYLEDLVFAEELSRTWADRAT
jgi:2-C-methyl-D-erythritol 4-phosphate cytidylyltransferase